MNRVEKRQWMNQLLDVYGMLLTAKQLDILNLYYKEDFSFAEIGEEKKISRAAVADHLKRSERMLEDYEKKLKVVASNEARMKIYGKIKMLQKKRCQSMD